MALGLRTFLDVSILHFPEQLIPEIGQKKQGFFPRSTGKILMSKGKIPLKLNHTNPTLFLRLTLFSSSTIHANTLKNNKRRLLSTTTRSHSFVLTSLLPAPLLRKEWRTRYRRNNNASVRYRQQCLPHPCHVVGDFAFDAPTGAIDSYRPWRGALPDASPTRLIVLPCRFKHDINNYFHRWHCYRHINHECRHCNMGAIDSSLARCSCEHITYMQHI